MRFSNKNVFITGSNRNTGFDIAEAFLQEGATVFLNGCTAESTANGTTVLKSFGFDRIIEIPCDIGNPLRRICCGNCQRQGGNHDRRSRTFRSANSIANRKSP
ncbi:MAG: hypothetical protein LBQ50_04140 [Planctomycetaceae bacterium]|nr:hypothetical protein [Planctomycetaceae bacterium]